VNPGSRPDKRKRSIPKSIALDEHSVLKKRGQQCLEKRCRAWEETKRTFIARRRKGKANPLPEEREKKWEVAAVFLGGRVLLQ